MDAKQRVAAALEQIDAARAERIVGAAFDAVRNIGQPALDIRGRDPSRPLFLAADPRDAPERQCVFANGYAVADRLTIGEHVIKITRVGIDDDRARRFRAMIVDEVALIGLWNRGLRIRRVGEQLPIARCEARFAGGLKRCLHAAAEHQADSSEKRGFTHCHYYTPPAIWRGPNLLCRLVPSSKLLKSTRYFQNFGRRCSMVADPCCRKAALRVPKL